MSPEPTDEQREQAKIATLDAINQTDNFIVLTLQDSDDEGGTIRSICSVSSEHFAPFMEALRTTGLTIMHDALGQYLAHSGVDVEAISGLAPDEPVPDFIPEDWTQDSKPAPEPPKPRFVVGDDIEDVESDA